MFPLSGNVVAQLVEWSLPTTEVLGSNSIIGEIFIHVFTINCIEKTNLKKKEAGKGPV